MGVPMARADCPLTSAPVRFYADREAAGGLPLGVTMLTLTDGHLPGTVAGELLPPRPCGRDNHEHHPHVCRRLYRPDRRPDRRSPRAGWRGRFSRDREAGRRELQQLASSPLSAGAMRLRAKYRKLAAANGAAATTPARQQGNAGDGRDRHRPARTLVRSGQARAEPAAVNSAR